MSVPDFSSAKLKKLGSITSIFLSSLLIRREKRFNTAKFFALHKQVVPEQSLTIFVENFRGKMRWRFDL